MNTTTYEDIFVARQPIFDQSQKAWGYLLLFRDKEDAQRALISNESDATFEVLCNMPLCGIANQPGISLMVHFTPETVAKGMPDVMPSETLVAVIDKNADYGTEFIRSIRALRASGYRVAQNGYDGTPGVLDKDTDIFMVNVSGKSSDELKDIAQNAMAASSGCLLLAKFVETYEEQQIAKKAGYSLFQGYYFMKPVVEKGRKISASQVSRLKLFEIIENEEPDFDSLAEAIEVDVALSYRLLAFLNSAKFGFAKTITSIRQAVVLAGWKPIRNWIRLVLLTDLNPSEKARELSYVSAHRAKLFETMALGGGYENESDRLFILGLFSLLDALLGMEFREFIDLLPIDTKIKETLCGGSNEYTPWLELAKAIERSDWDSVNSIAQRLGLHPGTVAVSYQHAFTWADAFFGNE